MGHSWRSATRRASANRTRPPAVPRRRKANEKLAAVLEDAVSLQAVVPSSQLGTLLGASLTRKSYSHKSGLP